MSYMLQEQRKINEELLGQMREMQMTMQDMRTRMGPGNNRGVGGGGGGWSDDSYDGFGSGYADGFGGGKMHHSQFMPGIIM